MFLFSFIIGSVLLAVLVFFLRSWQVDIIASITYILANMGLCAYSFLHIGESDSLYFQFDHLAVIFALVAVIIILPVFYHSYFYLQRKKDSPFRRSLYVASLILLLTFMNATFFSANLGLSWALTEGTTLFLAMLIFHERNQLALEATWKYIFISSIGIAIAFIGILFLSIGVSQGGVTDLGIDNIVKIAPSLNPLWLKIAFVCFLVGFSGKMGIFPFHTVTIDASAVAPPPIMALVGSCLKCVGFINIFRMYSILAQTSAHDWADKVLILVGTISIAIAALEMSKVRFFPRLLGYSSVEHMGFLMICLGMGGKGYYIAILHIILHSFAKAGFFLQVGQIHDIYLSNRIVKCGHYFRVYPFGSITDSFSFLTIAALPPSGLFVTEFLAFQTLFAQHHYLLAVLLFLCLLLILYFFAKNILQLLFSQGEINEPAIGYVLHPSETVIQGLLFALVVIIGFFPPAFLSECITGAVAVLVDK